MDEPGPPARDEEDRTPRTGGDIAQSGPVQVAMTLLLVLLALLSIWIVWSLFSAA